MSILHELPEYSKNTQYYKANTFFQSVELPYAIDHKNDPSNYSNVSTFFFNFPYQCIDWIRKLNDEDHCFYHFDMITCWWNIFISFIKMW